MADADQRRSAHVWLRTRSGDVDLGPHEMWQRAARGDRWLTVFADGGVIRVGDAPEIASALADLADEPDTDDKLAGVAYLAARKISTAAFNIQTVHVDVVGHICEAS